MRDHERFGIKVGQVYLRADGSSGRVKVVDVDTYGDVGDVVVNNSVKEYRIDCFKLARVRYYLEEEVSE